MKKLIKKIEKYYKSKQLSLFFYPLACLLYDSGAKEEAFDVLIEGVAKFPRYSLALIKISQILMDEEKYEAAQAYLETAIHINNANALAWELLAHSYEKQGKIEDTINAYEKLLVLNPSPKIKSKLMSLAPVCTPSVEKVKEIAEQTPLFDTTKNQTTVNNDVLILDVEKTSEVLPVENEPPTQEYSKRVIFEEIPTIDLEEDDQLNIAKLYVEQGYIEDAKNLYNEILARNPQNKEAKLALEELNEEK